MPGSGRVRAGAAVGAPSWGRQALLQALCLFVTFTVLFPILWIVSIAIDPRNIARPDSLNIIPPGANLDAFVKAIQRPTENPVSFLELAFNSLKLATATAMVSVAFGVSAAYAFSRLHFKFRQFLMIAVLGVLMLPSVATITPLFVLLNSVRFGAFSLRDSIPGVAMALISGALPFAIWNLKGYLDTIPKDLEEAARGRRCLAQPDVLPDHPAARHAGPRGHRVPRLRVGLDRVLLLVDVPDQAG